MFATFLVLIFSLFYACHHCHPQCLDFRPPFKATLKFCSYHSQYSCCTTSKDESLRHDYNYALSSTNESIKECEILLHELLCLECHPYAAHIYDAEIPSSLSNYFDKRQVNFPGLCKTFCLKQFDKCREYIVQVARHDEFYDFINNVTSETFCNWAQIADENYCYPDIKTIQNDEKRVKGNEKETIALCVEPWSETFANPLIGVHANDGTHRLFVGEQRGLIFIVDHTGKKLSDPFLNITSKILNSGSTWDERGLLGLTFHPKYRQNGHFYIYYSFPLKGQNYSSGNWWTKQHVSRVSEFTVSCDPNKADHNSELVIIEIKQPEANHNGGMLMFGRDNYLYLFPGDGGGSGDDHGAHGNALNLSTLLGKALRIDVQSKYQLYAIPKDNPFRGWSKVPSEIYALGLRNAWRCSIDGGIKKGRGTGRIFCGDVGQNRFEEINIIERGANYGWRAFEGFSCYDDKLCDSYNATTRPILSYNHSIGQSIVGGYVYRGCDNPKLFGKYFYADTMNGNLFVANEKQTKWQSKQVVMGNDSICNNGLAGFYAKNILSFSESETGELYLLTTHSPSPQSAGGRIYRIVDPTLRGDPERCYLKRKKPRILKAIKRRPIYYQLKIKRKENQTKKTTRE